MSESEVFNVRIHARAIGAKIERIADDCWIKIAFEKPAEGSAERAYQTLAEAKAGRANIVVTKDAGYHHAQVLVGGDASTKILNIRVEVLLPLGTASESAPGHHPTTLRDVAVADRAIDAGS